VIVFKGFIASRKKNTSGIDCDLVKLMIRDKPYSGGNKDLRFIFYLANIDKHLELIPAANYGKIKGISHFSIKNAISGMVFSGGLHSLTEGIIISELGEHGSITPKRPDAKIEVAGAITFSNVAGFDGRPIGSTLNSP